VGQMLRLYTNIWEGNNLQNDTSNKIINIAYIRSIIGLYDNDEEQASGSGDESSAADQGRHREKRWTEE